ncbi:alpha/beta hydrolase [Actinoalloteichus sp. AHMU CJ021]|uniref:Alpha/beta hydrolase family protein n=1 Tax=Actinoalloteichus caeruleus DSM 43889 TaxID=1120930 RepID=A0ABT1JK55_ACTCY|nr:alpha/beta hydrolase [Actinoalloteichus caeruleus]AUS78737.1 alpha/beta hydrolase [Actinoalloteichus sp. AHMU CJ021]MCP2332892.1 Alpha/beta hydrolase family protein [Actinoalloteichus caeruleus DSM 43889]
MRQSIDLGDGTTLGYRRGGVPGGPAVVVHHGLPRHDRTVESWLARAERHGLDLVVPDRPGHGLSSPARWRSPLDVCAPLDVLAERLDLGRFDVVGVAVGAPYAYATSVGLARRTRRLAVLAGIPFPPTPGDGGQRGPDEAADPSHQPTTSDGVSPPSGEPLGVDQDRRLVGGNWGFSADQVRHPVCLWHWREDDEVPFPSATASWALLPHAELRVRPGAGDPTDPDAEDELFDLLTEGR